MYVPAGDVSTSNTHANMASKQWNNQAELSKLKAWTTNSV